MKIYRFVIYCCPDTFLLFTDAETERLLNEIEDNLRMLVPNINTLDTEYGIDLSLAMQPLRSENANLRRYMQIKVNFA